MKYVKNHLLACTSIVLLAAGVSPLRSDSIHDSHDYDRQTDQVIYGGYSYAAAVTQAGGEPGATTRRAEETLEARRLYAVSATGDGTTRVLYEASDGVIVAFKASGQGRVAVLVALDQESQASPRSQKVELRIVNSSGSRQGNAIPNVRDFAWDATGSKLAYCTGRPDEAIDDVRMDGTWVFEVGSGAPTKILDTGRHVAWAGFDGNLYIYDVPTSAATEPRVLRFDPTAGTVEEAPYKGIDFSPSGDFYFRRKSPNYGRFDLFESTTNRSFSSSQLSELVPQAVGWLPDRDILVFESWYYGKRDGYATQPVPHTMLYDPNSDSVVDLGEVALVGLDAPQLVVRSKDGVLLRRSSDQLLRKGATGA